MNFFARYKKLFLILLFLAVVILFGYLLWRLFFQTASPIGPTSPAASTTIGGLPAIGGGGTEATTKTGPGTLPGQTEGGLTPGQSGLGGNTGANPLNEASPVAVGGLTKTDNLVSAPVLGSVLSADGRVQYYNQDDGKFYRVDANGKTSLLSDKTFHQVQNVTWAPDKNRAILEYPDGTKIFYDFNARKQVTLPGHWQDFSFSADSRQIVAKSLGLDPENRWLMVADADGANARAIEAIGTNDATIYPSWSPNKQIIAYYTQGVDFNRQEVFFVGLNDENFKSTIVEGRGLQAQWSTSGDRLLYSVYNSADNMNPRLWIVDAQGNAIGSERQSLDLATWANKCSFANNTEIYCAVPEYLEAGAGLFPELADRTKDELYKIDLVTGAKKLLAVPDGAYNISQLRVTGNQDYLFFTDKKNGQLYKIKLK